MTKKVEDYYKNLQVGAFVIGNMDSTSSLDLAFGTFFGIIIFVGIFSIGIFSIIFKALGTNPYSNEATVSFTAIVLYL